ncbi:hypothetical protein ACTA71_009776 [Dictyostelium dimigraforme]
MLCGSKKKINKLKFEIHCHSRFSIPFPLPFVTISLPCFHFAASNSPIITTIEKCRNQQSKLIIIIIIIIIIIDINNNQQSSSITINIVINNCHQQLPSIIINHHQHLSITKFDNHSQWVVFRVAFHPKVDGYTSLTSASTSLASLFLILVL